jgi:hypothetical protein
MTRRNLSDVLLKILGVYMVLYAVPSAMAALALGLESLAQPQLKQALALNRAFSFVWTDGFRAVIGLFLIIKSWKIAGYWYESENE